MSQLPAAGTKFAPPADPPDVLAARLEVSRARAGRTRRRRRARELARAQQPHAPVHPLRRRRAARVAAALPAPACGRGQLRRPAGCSHERPARVDGPGRLPASPGAAAGAGGLPAAALAADAAPRWPARPRAGAAAVDPPARQLQLALPEHAASAGRAVEARAANQITKGAVMKFEHDRELDRRRHRRPDRLAHAADRRGRRQAPERPLQLRLRAPRSSRSADAVERRPHVLTSPGNTGIPAPNRTRHLPRLRAHPGRDDDRHQPRRLPLQRPGISWISYFNGGDALHAFTARSFGTPQSLGCVELPLAAAAKVWPYTPIGTLVTIET